MTNDLSLLYNIAIRWNRYCDETEGMDEYDYLYVNSDNDYLELYDSIDEALSEIVNSSSPEFRRNDGYLIALTDNEGKYYGMLYVPSDEVGKYRNVFQN